MSYDWDLIDKLGRLARYQSESEKADAVYLSKARNYELYAKPEDEEMSPLIAWTLSDEWTDRKPFEGTMSRGHKVISDGRRFSLPDGVTSGEIKPSR